MFAERFEQYVAAERQDFRPAPPELVDEVEDEAVSVIQYQNANRLGYRLESRGTEMTAMCISHSCVSGCLGGPPETRKRQPRAGCLSSILTTGRLPAQHPDHQHQYCRFSVLQVAEQVPVMTLSNGVRKVIDRLLQKSAKVIKPSAGFSINDVA